MKAFFPFIVRILASALGVFTNFILARHLGVEVFGIYSSMLSITFIINLFTDWGFNAYGAQLLAQKEAPEQKIQFVHQVLSFKLLLAAFFSIGYAATCFIFMKQPFYYLAGVPIILFSFLNPEWICRGLLKPDMASYRQLVFSILNILIFCLLYWLKTPVWLIFAAYVCNTIVSFYYVIYLLKQKVHFEINIFPFKLKSILESGIIQKTSSYFYGYLINNINYTAPIIVLTLWSNSHNVGIYASYYNIFSTLIAPVMISYGLFAPKIHLTDKAVFYKSYFFTISCIVVAGVVFYIYGSFFYKLFYPKSFEFNSELNFISGVIFVLYCLENMFVVCGVLEIHPKRYIIANLVGLISAIIAFAFIFINDHLDIKHCFLVVLTTQISMIFTSLYWYYGLLKMWLNKKIVGLFAITGALLFTHYYFPNSIVLMILAALLLTLSAYYIFKLLKHLY